MLCAVVWAVLEEGWLSYRFLAINLALSAILLFVLMRFGLIAAISNYFYCAIVITGFPVTLEASAWYAKFGYAALAVLGVVVFYSFRTLLGGRPSPRLLAPG